MRVPSVRKWFRKRFRPDGIILMYHRIAVEELDPWGMSVSPGHFAEHLQVLIDIARPIGLKQLIERRRRCLAPRRAVAITFDDGYADNLHDGLPLLEKYEIPATVFAVSEKIGSQGELWWDELQRLLMKVGTLPEVLELNLNGQSWRCELGKARKYSRDEYKNDRHARAWEAPDATRLSFYHAVWRKLRDLPEDSLRKAMDEIHLWSGISDLDKTVPRLLSSAEFLTLGRNPLIEIGAHTVRHSCLPTQPLSVQRDEIQSPKKKLEHLLGQEVSVFSYPFGEYNDETIDLVRNAGYSCACTTKTGTVKRCGDVFQLPRFNVGDWDGDTFAKRLLEWFDR